MTPLNELNTIFHSIYQLNVFQIDEIYDEDTSAITVHGNAETMDPTQIGDAGHMMHTTDRVRRG